MNRFKLSSKEIKKRLPYGEPFLMVDTAEVQKKGVAGVGYKQLTGEEYYFEGHFPKRPVMPGVLIAETISQTAMLVVPELRLKMKNIDRMKFRQTIEPGDKMEVKVVLEEKENDRFVFSGEVFVGENIAASGKITLVPS